MTTVEKREVTSYVIRVYGSPIGWQNSRAQITLTGANGTIAWIRFHDSGMLFENDNVTQDNIITMHLPSEMFNNVLDVLRNEKPVYIEFIQDRGFLSTSIEDVGEGEII